MLFKTKLQFSWRKKESMSREIDGDNKERDLNSTPSGEFGILAQSIINMWSEVPVEAIEEAPSSVGLFEQEEISLVADSISEHYSDDYEMILFGSATAKREEMALSQAEINKNKNLFVNKITAVDIAPQFIRQARRRLEKMFKAGRIGDYDAVVSSIEDLPISENSGRGIVTMGLYNLDCLLNTGRESTGEEVALEEYAGGMSEILGNHTVILPLFYEEGRFYEGEPVVTYDSSDFIGNLGEIRETLKNFRRKNKNLVGLRVSITREPTSSQDTEQPVFLSTWFDSKNLARVFKQNGFKTRVSAPKRAKKGFVLTINNEKSSSKKTRHATLMNNVLGNLHIDTLNSVIDVFKQV